MKKYWLSILCLLIAIVAFVAYYWIYPSYVDETGMVIEKFWLIPTRYLFFFLALLSAIIVRFRAKKNKA